ncbi:hypothetical protein L6250_03025 [Candidatus Parcubacteria bacterium]|nr:hypothetical protein [Candidatus Parcubacteria bacterium]
MTTNELKVLEIIWDWGGEVSVDIITRQARISLDYARLVCKSLDKEGYIDFLHSKLCKIKSKGKLAVAKRKGVNSKKIVIPAKLSKFGLGKNKRGGLILNYG